jgi:all-trans-retinol 13,14-reductase
MTPKDAPFIMHSVGFATEKVPKFYYPTGGPGMIAKKVIRSIEANGGRVRLNSEVSKVIIEGGRAVGVKLENGKTIRAKHQIISDAGFAKTFHDFVPEELLPSRSIRNAARNDSLKNGMTGIVLYVGLKGYYDEDFNLPGNVSVVSPLSGGDEVPLPDTISELASLDAGDLTLYITCPSAKDGSWKKKYPGKTSLEIMLMNVPWKAFQPLVDQDGRLKEERKEIYEEFKSSFGQLMWTRSRQALVKVGAAADKLPERLKDAEVVEVGTPLTFQRFLGSRGGAWYGLQHNRERFKPRNYYVLLRPECGDIPGLFLTGQDVATDGVVGALLGGYLCAAKILGLKTPSDVVEHAVAVKEPPST